MMTLHGSDLKAYERCPRAWRLQKDHPEIPSDTSATRKGTALHRCAEAYLRALDSGASTAAADEAARVALAESGLHTDERKDAEFFLRSLLKQPLPEKIEGDEWFIEQGFGFTEDHLLTTRDDPAATFAGTLDFLCVNSLTGKAIVVDWKTGRAVQARGDLATDPKMRGYAIAAVALAEVNGVVVNTVTLRLHYTSLSVIQSITFTAAEVEAFKPHLATSMETLRTDDECKALPDFDKCVRCPVRYLCDAYRGAGMDAIEVKDAASAADAYRQAAILDSRATDLKSAVRAFVERDGPIPYAPGKAVALQMQEKRSVRDDAVATLRAEGFSAEQILEVASLTVGALERLADEDTVARCCEVAAVQTLRVGKA